MLLGCVAGSSSAFICIWVDVPGKFSILPKCYVTSPAKDGACFWETCREKVLNLLVNYCKAEKSAEGDTALLGVVPKGRILFLSPLFFHPAFVRVVHFLPRHQASRRALPFEETQRSVKEKKEEVGWSMWRRCLWAGGSVDHAGVWWAGACRDGVSRRQTDNKMGVGDDIAVSVWCNSLRSVQETDPK